MDAEFICRQTNYTLEEAEEKLLELKDPVLVIRHYLAAKPQEKKEKTVNQMIYNEISKFTEGIKRK
jgi:hypothetical protein